MATDIRSAISSPHTRRIQHDRGQTGNLHCLSLLKRPPAEEGRRRFCVESKQGGVILTGASVCCSGEDLVPHLLLGPGSLSHLITCNWPAGESGQGLTPALHHFTGWQFFPTRSIWRVIQLCLPNLRGSEKRACFIISVLGFR